MFFSRKVLVTFLDSRSGAVIGKTKMRPDELPESFLIKTTMHLDDDEWSVVSAEPATREEYSEARKLVLTLAPIQKIDPSSLLYSVPTITTELPAESGDLDGSEIAIAEDSWRQVELVGAEHRSLVETEIESIARIHAEHRKGLGFTKIHVRETLRSPLSAKAVSPAAIEATTTDASRPLRFHGHDARVSGGFAHPVDGDWIVYGTKDAERVTALCLEPGSADLSPSMATTLETVARDNELLLVDWCRCVVGEPGEAAIAEICGGRSGAS